jgi:hypothetical protein
MHKQLSQVADGMFQLRTVANAALTAGDAQIAFAFAEFSTCLIHKFINGVHD